MRLFTYQWDCVFELCFKKSNRSSIISSFSLCSNIFFLFSSSHLYNSSIYDFIRIDVFPMCAHQLRFNVWWRFSNCWTVFTISKPTSIILVYNTIPHLQAKQTKRIILMFWKHKLWYYNCIYITKILMHYIENIYLVKPYISKSHILQLTHDKFVVREMCKNYK